MFVIPAALLVALYGVSVLVVTALTPDSAHTTQVVQLALSVVWTIWGVAMLAAGVLRASTLGVILRRGGIALTGVAAAKVLIVDTARFDTAHRAGVFLALGLILLAGAWAYAGHEEARARRNQRSYPLSAGCSRRAPSRAPRARTTRATGSTSGASRCP